MNQDVIYYIHKSFEMLTTTHGLSMVNEINEDGYYMVEYGSKDFVIEIEKYYRELYVSVYKINKSEDGVNLFNLLDYLKQDFADKPKSNYFAKEISLEESYRKQISYIITTLFENYLLVKDFFKSNDRMDDFEKYWKNKHPELYKSL